MDKKFELSIGCTFFYSGLNLKVVPDGDVVCGCDCCVLDDVFPEFCCSQKCVASHRKDKTGIHYETVNE